MAAAAYKITRTELADELDKQARAKLGVSGDRFLNQLKAGELDLTDPATAELAVLARLITD